MRQDSQPRPLLRTVKWTEGNRRGEQGEGIKKGRAKGECEEALRKLKRCIHSGVKEKGV